MSIPEVFFRETIDLNRYSNAVSTQFAKTYVDVILIATGKLKKIDLKQQTAETGVIISPQTRKRLRAIISQSKKSLDSWAKVSTKEIIKEIEGLAKVQTGFIENELKKAVKSGNIPINSVAVNKKYAESFVKTDPTQVNIFTSKQFTEDDFIKFGSGKFELTARQGAMQTLPNGDTVEKAFRGIARKNQDLLARSIRQGVFSGESTQEIARRLAGRLDFGFEGNAKQIALAGGESIKVATHQIQTIVRTSVNQVQNQASQAVYAANSKVAPKYEYVATLDSRTSPICRRLDGRKFAYNKGPTPPQHFNCRSTTVPIVDYEGLSKRKGFEDLKPPPKGKVVTRPTGEGGGRVPQNTQYGDWLLGADKKTKIKTLGNEQKVRYFERLAKKEGSGQKAIRKMVREDGSERSLKDLEKLYGKPSGIKSKAKPKPKVTAPVETTPQVKTSPVLSTDGVDKWLAGNKFAKNSQQFIEESLDSMEGLGGLTGENIKKMRKFMKKGNVINHFNMRGEKTLPVGDLKKRYLSGDNLKLYEKSNQTVIKRFEINGKKDVVPKETKEWLPFWDGLGTQRYNSQKDLIDRNIRILKEGKISTDQLFDKKVQSTFFHNATGMANGFTSGNSAIVHTRLKPAAKKINTTLAKEIKASAKNTLNNQNLLKTKDYDYIVKNRLSEIWSNSQPMPETIDWFSTFVHEMGHQVHYQSGGATLGRQFMKLKGLTYPTQYSRKNHLEQFAESFTQYIFNPEGLKEQAPRLYKWVDEAVEEAIKNT